MNACLWFLLLPSLQHPANQALGVGASSPARLADHVLLISVDGLRSDALVAGGRTELPALHRLMAASMTLNARPDPDYTVTLPNHVGILTGHRALGPEGHGWTGNIDPPPGATLAENRGSYLPGIFDLAHDRGLHTALFAGKTKFILFETSWDQDHGAPDPVPPDDGRGKIDEFLISSDTALLYRRALHALGAAPRSLVFLHDREPDYAGHYSGWDLTPGSPYRRSVAGVDRRLGPLLDGIASDPELADHTVVILTADHGGGAPFHNHEMAGMWIDAIVPFLVWAGDRSGPPADLYALNTERLRNPGIRVPGPDGPQPLRNFDAASMTLQCLGLRDAGWELGPGIPDGSP